MHPQERNLLRNFLDRFNHIPPQTPDPEANALIHQAVQRPDAAYLLVQQALVQEVGLQQAEQRIQQLEQELQAARSSTASASGGGSFLSGILGGRRGGWTDAPASPSVAPATRSGWGPNEQNAFVAPTPPVQRGGGFGGFLASAAATAAGVAGGALLFEGVKNFMGGQNDTVENTAEFTPDNGLFSSFAPNANNESSDSGFGSDDGDSDNSDFS